jgi:hypothetical protein
MFHVEIERVEPGSLARRHADERAGPAPPQITQCVWIDGGVEVSVRSRRALGRGAREAFAFLGGERQSSAERCGDLGRCHASLAR